MRGGEKAPVVFMLQPKAGVGGARSATERAAPYAARAFASTRVRMRWRRLFSLRAKAALACSSIIERR